MIPAKDYAMIATVLCITNPGDSESMEGAYLWDDIVRTFAHRFASEPGFDRDAFLKGCGL